MSDVLIIILVYASAFEVMPGSLNYTHSCFWNPFIIYEGLLLFGEAIKEFNKCVWAILYHLKRNIMTFGIMNYFYASIDTSGL